MCSYKSLLPQPCSRYSQTERRSRQECAATSPYCLSPAVGTQVTERRTRQECSATSPYCLSPVVSTKRQREELDRNVQLQVLIASALQSVLRDREKNQIGMCSYKSLLPQSCSQYSQTERRTRQEYVQLQVLIASALQSVLRDREKNQIGMCNYKSLLPLIDCIQVLIRIREKNQIGMCSYKSLLPQSCSQYSQMERRTRQECAATSPYCLSPVVSTKRQREELDRNVQLQVLIASALQL